MITDETRPEDFHYKRNNDFSHIKGWGIDADPKNDPTYPLKRRTDEEQLGYIWERPEQQPETVEILKSVERPNITAVFGTAAPPYALSGMIRRLAYKYSESDYRRWVPLIFADRVNMVEGVLEDLSEGRLPNIFKEKGMNAELKYNKKEFIIKVAAGIALTVAVAGLFIYRDKKQKL